MSRYTGPKNKKARRIGQDLDLTTSTSKLARRLGIPPGVHGRKGHKKLSNYGAQLKEKQKVRWMYGVPERQLKRYYQKAIKTKAATGEELLRLLEKRLDNVIYRLGFAPTRNFARQLVNHGHVLVDNQKVTIPSYSVKKSQLISLTSKATQIPLVKKCLEQKNVSLPSWLQRKAVIGQVTQQPAREDIGANINEQLIVEFYSR